MTINREAEYRELAEDYLRTLASLQNVFVPSRNLASGAAYRQAVEMVQDHAKSAYKRVKHALERIERGDPVPPDLLERFMVANRDIVAINYGAMNPDMEDVEVSIEYTDGHCVNTQSRTLTAHMIAFLKEP